MNSRSSTAMSWSGRMLAAWLLGVFAPLWATAGEPAVPGYLDYDAYTAKLKKLDASDLVTVTSLGKTLGGREIWMATLSQGNPAGKPAWLIVGSTSPSHLVGSELAVRMIEQLVEQAATDEALRTLLTRYAIHVIPRPSPDASEYFFRKPYSERNTNERSLDDDRDGQANEDGPEDLNGDGWITQMRVESPDGTWMADPHDARLMVKADPRKNQRGQWLVYTEGSDNDKDEEWNEDGPGGVDFNHNFTFAYPYFASGAGPHQVSEIESRAVADFAFQRLNIGLVFSFSPQDNLLQTWPTDAINQPLAVKATIPDADAPYLKYIAEKYRTLHGGKNAPATDDLKGAFAPWAYFHYGRWSFSTRAWWPSRTEGAKDDTKKDDAKKDEAKKGDKPAEPGAEADKQAGEKGAAESKPAGQQETDKPKPSQPPQPKADAAKAGGKGDSEQHHALAWLDREQIDGFVPWKKFEHPDFPGQTVEIGGFKPYLITNPPLTVVDDLTKKQVQFLSELGGLMPQLKLDKPKVEKLGEGVFRLTVTVRNEGFLPTVSTAGQTNQRVAPTQLKLTLPEGAKLVNGSSRVHVRALPGRGGSHEQIWLIFAGSAPAPNVTVKAWHPAVGEDTQTAVLK